jgi:hypothetical protein
MNNLNRPCALGLNRPPDRPSLPAHNPALAQLRQRGPDAHQQSRRNVRRFGGDPTIQRPVRPTARRLLAPPRLAASSGSPWCIRHRRTVAGVEPAPPPSFVILRVARPEGTYPRAALHRRRGATARRPGAPVPQASRTVTHCHLWAELIPTI